MRPSELCRLLNSTPLGVVTDERKLYRQRSRAGFRIGDDRHVDLFRYVAWLEVLIVVQEIRLPRGLHQRRPRIVTSYRHSSRYRAKILRIGSGPVSDIRMKKGPAVSEAGPL
jgi:hypothetical protein